MRGLKFFAYCGMMTVNVTGDSCRDLAAALIRKRRKEGFEVTTLERGKEWEVIEPNGVMIVPEECGFLCLNEDNEDDEDDEWDDEDDDWDEDEDDFDDDEEEEEESDELLESYFSV